MRKDPETWKCVGVGILVWIAAWVSIIGGRIEFGLGSERPLEPVQEGVVFSRVITQEGEYLITENLATIRP